MLDWITWVSSWPKGPAVLDKEPGEQRRADGPNLFQPPRARCGAHLERGVVTDLETELQ